MKKNDTSDPRVYADLERLISLRHQARGFDFLPRRVIGGPFPGRYASKLRGRGLNIEELRRYYPGDDIRLMDWKATIRTGKPHVRTYTEERDRFALILVDQRMSMFFGSREKMKSVIAAEAAALAAWRVMSAGDRVGGLIFGDESVTDIRPQRNFKTLLRLLSTIVDYNHRLKAGQASLSPGHQLNKILSKAEKLSTHDFLIIIVSDLNGWDETSVKHLKTIARHNDVVVFYVYDPLEKKLPKEGKFVVTDGKLQIEFDPAEKSVGQRFSERFSNTVDYLEYTLKRHAVPVVLMDTLCPVRDQMQSAIGEQTKR
jgi:uncharacterized protein (DUF58 family)